MILAEKLRKILHWLKPYNMIKGFRYLKHFGWKEFLIRLQERMEPEEVPYGPWYEYYRPTQEELSAQRAVVWTDPVTFSVIVPAWKTPERYLKEMIYSVHSQTYPYWELYVVNASPSDERMHEILSRSASKDPRIHEIILDENRGIAENTNAGLFECRGDFAAFLDHDDLLSPAALYKLAQALKKAPDCDLIYTDEDKISEDGTEHFQPHLKPDYNPDLLRSNNYICHFLAVRRTLACRLGGLDGAYNGAQDYDFILRCTENARRVVHVPEILYHWRTHAASTADNPVSKQYAYEAGRQAISAHLKRTGTPGEVVSLKDPGFYRVIYPVRDEPLISIIIPNADQHETLRACLESVFARSTYHRYEIIIVENNSKEEETFAYYRTLEKEHGVKIVRFEGAFNYSAVNNLGVQYAKGDYLLLLNNDTRVITPEWMEEMLGVCQRPEVGIVGARLYYPDDTVQHAGIVVGIGGVAGSLFVGMKRQYTGYLHKAGLLQDLSAVTAACMMVKRSVYTQLGGMQEQLAVAFNDVDFCLRAGKAGYLTVYDPYVQLYHDESKTRGTEDSKEKVRRFQREIEYMRTHHLDILRDGDPNYNKNLSLTKWNYSLKPEERMG